LIIVVDPIKILKPSALMPGDEMIEKSKTREEKARIKSKIDLDDNLKVIKKTIRVKIASMNKNFLSNLTETRFFFLREKLYKIFIRNKNKIKTFIISSTFIIG